LIESDDDEGDGHDVDGNGGGGDVLDDKDDSWWFQLWI
jgi:hypothetical protein